MKPVWFLWVFMGLTYSIPINQNTTERTDTEFDEDYPEENPGLFEGDIELREGEDPNNRNAVTDKSRLWSNGKVPYTISSHYPSNDQATIRNAMRTIEEKTKVNGKKCIHFTPHNNERQYIRFESGTGCHTPIGKGHTSSTVTLGRGCLHTGVVMHEINHALGTYHEQSRHDRDNYITVDYSNIQKGQEHNFVKFKSSNIDELNQPYDFQSIMHYSAYSFAKDRSKPVIVPKIKGVVLGQRTHLSTIDIKEIQILYGCIPRPHGK
ncbi:hypothetical protein LOTGIDRAFT_209446 [Lottia gigantea]|uniref:Metalloendopeptidase n=1 Tax=Lottia gigantea TaxID=225164 RepID=V3ZR74_LOTGI|nr:hypothetical protein LOTGIDRAFT_209446 [Lottia gigantea]ESO93913.1 hypothetical protein LOTGIDRAFT_209446 [Lottia gigantea]